jgi:hypothetical protein
MTILWVGMEDIDFQQTLVFSWSTTPQRSGYDRGKWNEAGSAGAYLWGNNWSATSADFWFSFWWTNNTGGFNSNANWIKFKDAGGLDRLLLQWTSTPGVLSLYKQNAAATQTLISSQSAAINTTGALRKIDVHVVYSGSGSVTLYESGVQIATWSGSLTTDAITALQSAYVSPGGSGTINMSEMIVADTDTRTMSVVSLTSSTAGATQAWTGTASNVNQNSVVNDANYIYSDTATQIQEYKPGALPSGTFTVAAVVMSVRALKGASGPQNLQMVNRVGSTDYTPLSAFSPSGSFANTQSIIATNPATSVAWTTSDIDATNFQYGLKSVA